ncbi:MAG: tRNA epoxyqueuosine(34) reductase QueG [Microthrixaceae bacterium]
MSNLIRPEFKPCMVRISSRARFSGLMGQNGEVEPLSAQQNAEFCDQLLSLGRLHGLAAIGVCKASPFLKTRQVLEERRSQGLNAEMAFTYRNPARSTDPSVSLPGVKSLVVAAYRYETSVPDAPLKPAARVARYATADHYEQLRFGLGKVAEMLTESGFRALVLADDNALVDRAAAVRAGIGWFGKSSNVLLPGEGSWFLLGSVLTDAELPVNELPLEDGCGSCQRCIDGCPTQAIIAPGVLDARKCLAWLLQAQGDFPHEFRQALGDRIYGCDECQEVCPPSRRSDSQSQQHDAQLDASQAPGSWIDLHWLLSASEEELLASVGRWYIPARDARYVRRNALVVLGNSAQPLNTELQQLLERYLDDPDDLLASHAAWAALELGQAGLLNHPTRSARVAIVAERAIFEAARQRDSSPEVGRGKP